MPSTQRKSNFYDSEAGAEAKQVLRSMVSDKAFNTEASYSANSDLYPKHSMSFEEKHMAYLNAHPATDSRHYLANLRLMTRVR